MKRVIHAPGLLLALVATACGPTSSGAETGETGPAPLDCPDNGPASGEFVITPLQTNTDGVVDCSVGDVRLAADDLDIEIDLDCEGLSRTIKLGPASERPVIEAGQAVTFTASYSPAGCADAKAFTIHDMDGELIAAGLTPTQTVTELDSGAAGTMTFTRKPDDEGCSIVELELGPTATAFYTGWTQMIEAGDARFWVDVGTVRSAVGYGDDCGGDDTLYDAIVMRVP